jgi:hypothetical protein
MAEREELGSNLLHLGQSTPASSGSSWQRRGQGHHEPEAPPPLVATFTIHYDWADRFPVIVEAAARLKAQSLLIDGEVVIARDDRTPGAARWSKGQYQSNASGSRVA